MSSLCAARKLQPPLTLPVGRVRGVSPHARHCEPGVLAAATCRCFGDVGQDRRRPMGGASSAVEITPLHPACMQVSETFHGRWTYKLELPNLVKIREFVVSAGSPGRSAACKPSGNTVYGQRLNWLTPTQF
eukprot:scaffold193885_cov39-Tisochrysis_lutea.AAC.4